MTASILNIYMMARFETGLGHLGQVVYSFSGSSRSDMVNEISRSDLDSHRSCVLIVASDSD